MVAQRFLAPFVGVRVPTGQPLETPDLVGHFFYFWEGREPLGSTTKVACKLLGEALRSKEPSEARAETSTTVRASSIPTGQLETPTLGAFLTSRNGKRFILY